MPPNFSNPQLLNPLSDATFWLRPILLLLKIQFYIKKRNKKTPLRDCCREGALIKKAKNPVNC